MHLVVYELILGTACTQLSSLASSSVHSPVAYLSNNLRLVLVRSEVIVKQHAGA